jgi:hypothetical protein
MGEEPLPTSRIAIRVAAVRALLAPPVQFQAIGANDVVALRHKTAPVASNEGGAASGAALGVPVIVQ